MIILIFIIILVFAILIDIFTKILLNNELKQIEKEKSKNIFEGKKENNFNTILTLEELLDNEEDDGKCK